jgi:hypothetical protein
VVFRDGEFFLRFSREINIEELVCRFAKNLLLLALHWSELLGLGGLMSAFEVRKNIIIFEERVALCFFLSWLGLGRCWLVEKIKVIHCY